MKGIKKYLKDNLGIILALVAMILFLYIYPKTHNTFLTTNNIFNVLRQSATNLMLACGMTMVIILGGIDLSVGSIIAMSGVLGAAAVVWHGLPEIVGILIAILSGVIFGLLNGLVIAKTKILGMGQQSLEITDAALMGQTFYITIDITNPITQGWIVE